MLENFLFVFELESGGIFFGCLGIIINVVHFCGLTYMFLYKTDFLSNLYRSLNTFGDGEERLMAFVIFIYGYIFLSFSASVILLNGIKKRNHKHVLFYIITNAILMTLFAILMFNVKVLTGFIIEGCLIFSTVFTYSLYKKLENQSKQATVTAMYPIVQNVPVLQQAYGLGGFSQVPTNSQPQIHHQPQVYQMHQFNQQSVTYPQAQLYPTPHAYQQSQAYQQSSSQHNSKLEQANQLPSYDSVVPLAPQIYIP